MNALVLKTNKIVNIVEKRGEHYLDNNFNPYTKDELEFFINQNINNSKKRVVDDDDENEDEEQEIMGVEMNGRFISFAELNQIQMMNSHLEKVLWLAATVIEQHPDFNARQVSDFCMSIYRILKDNLRNGQ